MENNTSKKITARDKYNQIVNHFIHRLEYNDIEPWTKSWSLSLPKNYETGNSYQGMNILTLLDRGFSDSRWLTFNQIKKLGGSVNKGENSSPIFFMKPVEKQVEDEYGEVMTESYYLMQSYNVFNIKQTSGIEYEKENSNSQLEYKKSQDFINSLDLKTSRGEPSYSPEIDTISMPLLSEFESMNEYYSTYYHEIAHWSGHESRLDRLDKFAVYGDEKYAFEELIAELSSAFTSLEMGIKPNSKKQAAYLKAWITALKEKPNILYTAASQASKATTYLLEQSNLKKQLQVKDIDLSVSLDISNTPVKKNNNNNSNGPKIA